LSGVARPRTTSTLSCLRSYPARVTETVCRPGRCSIITGEPSSTFTSTWSMSTVASAGSVATTMNPGRVSLHSCTTRPTPMPSAAASTNVSQRRIQRRFATMLTTAL
jgi:hypothetical protein